MQRPSIMPIHTRDSLNWSLAPSKPLREVLTHSNSFEIAKKIWPGMLKRSKEEERECPLIHFHFNLHIQSPTHLQAIASNAALDIISHLTCAHAISYQMFTLQSQSYPVCSQHRSFSSFSPRHNHYFPLYSNLELDGDNSSCQYHR